VKQNVYLSEFSAIDFVIFANNNRDRMLAQKRELHQEAEVSEENGAGSSEDENEEEDVNLAASSRRVQQPQEREQPVQNATRRATLRAVPEQEQEDVTSQATVPRAEDQKVCVCNAGYSCAGCFIRGVHFRFGRDTWLPVVQPWW
jgi:hypothetical protein